eukprot:m.304183 g.304183  ORF g.304183 m.304183 type:complete len:456 (+) comp40844_c0_seq46:5172-6539(+)
MQRFKNRFLRMAISDDNLRRAGREFTVKYPYGYVMWDGPILSRLVATHPDCVKAVVGSEPKAKLYRVVKGILGVGLILAEGAEWRRHRHLLTPAFHLNMMKPYVKIYNDRCRKTIDILLSQNGKPVEVFDIASKLTLEILLQCGFSHDCSIQTGSTSVDEFQKATFQAKLECLYRFTNPLWYNDFLYSLSNSGRRYAAACNTIHQKVAEIIAQRRNEKQDNTESFRTRQHLDFLDLLLEARDENGYGLKDSEIRDEVATLLFAGHDTSGSALSWTLYLLASHQDELKRCQEEADSVLGIKKDVEWEDLSRLTYLTMCIKESLRQRPPTFEFSRSFKKDTEIAPGKIIPAFTEVSVNLYALHHNPDLWNDPEKFDPTRFTSENSKNRSPYAYIPFSAGPRNCLGQHFAMHELQVIVVQIIRKFNLNVLEGHPVLMHSTFVLTAKHGIKLHFQLRQP